MWEECQALEDEVACGPCPPNRRRFLAFCWEEEQTPLLLQKLAPLTSLPAEEQLKPPAWELQALLAAEEAGLPPPEEEEAQAEPLAEGGLPPLEEEAQAEPLAAPQPQK